MKTTCDIVAERIALGEALAEHEEHVQSCEQCKRLVALPVELGVVHSEVDPGLGFTARMTAGAQHRIAVRRRRRITGSIALAVVASIGGVFVMTREHPPNDTPAPAVAQRQHEAPEPTGDEANDPDVQTLVQMADVERTNHISANWKAIEKPLAPYRELLEGKIEP